jgi:aminopeptidase YwaD
VFKKPFEAIRQEFSGQAAKGYVIDIARYHRIQASPGFRQAAHYCLECLREAGVEAEVLSFPANDTTQYWSAQMFQEWKAAEATLHLVEPEDERRKLADFRACPISLIQRSAPFEGETEVVLLEDGEEEAEYEGLDLTGKVVLTKGDVDRVRQLAVEKRGAVGILFDGMRETPPVRARMDVPDALQYTSFWWSGQETKCFGFVLSPREGEKLRGLIKKQTQDGEAPVKVRAKVISRLYDGEIEVVSALIPGETSQEVVIVAHLCHPRPSANDNASGSAAALEIARTLRKLIDSGKLAPPQRGIRFLWVPEMTGTYAYLATREDEIERMVAGLNLDMVGQNQELCGSSFLIECPPQALPSFAPDLLERLREELLGETSALGGTGQYPLFRHAVIPFSGGSDHYILSDPSVGVPTPMIIQWPDKFYHTSQDTPDKVDPAMLGRVGSLAATYAYFLANAGQEEATWLGYEMMARFKRDIVYLIQEKVTEATNIGEETDKLGETIALLRKKVAYLVEGERQALASLKRLSPEIAVDGWQEEVTEFANRESAQGEEAIRAWGQDRVELPEASKRELDKWEEKAAKIVPRRLYRGPVSLRSYLLSQLSEEERERVWQLRKEHKKGFFTLPTLAVYRTDGQRSLLEITDLIELETGQRDVELLVEYFQTLGKLNLVELEASSQ